MSFSIIHPRSCISPIEDLRYIFCLKSEIKEKAMNKEAVYVYQLAIFGSGEAVLRSLPII